MKQKSLGCFRFTCSFIHLLSLFFPLSLSPSPLSVSLSFNLFLFVILHLFQYFKIDKIDVVFVPHNIDTKRNTFKEILKKLRTLILWDCMHRPLLPDCKLEHIITVFFFQ